MSIPTRLRKEALAACLRRLAPGSQTLSWDHYEVIVSDDGFAEENGSAETLVRNDFPWASWGRGERRGPAANRNAGARLARGQWLVFIDDDCLPASGWLQAYADAAESSNDVRHVFEGQTICEAGLTHPLDHAPVNVHGGCLWSCNMAIRHRVFDSLGGFDEDFPYAHMEDIDLRERLRNRGIPFHFIETAVVNHPPVRFTWRSSFGPYAESELMYWYKQGQPGPHAARLVRQILRFRAAWLLRGAHTPRALFPIAVISVREILYVLLRVASWDRKYHAQFGMPTSPP